METKVPSQLPQDGLKSWPGYTLDDLRYQRAVNHVKMEVERERLIAKAHRLVNRQQNMMGGGIARKLFSGFSVVDYALLAFHGVKYLRRIYRMVRR